MMRLFNNQGRRSGGGGGEDEMPWPLRDMSEGGGGGAGRRQPPPLPHAQGHPSAAAAAAVSAAHPSHGTRPPPHHPDVVHRGRYRDPRAASADVPPPPPPPPPAVTTVEVQNYPDGTSRRVSEVRCPDGSRRVEVESSDSHGRVLNRTITTYPPTRPHPPPPAAVRGGAVRGGLGWPPPTDPRRPSRAPRPHPDPDPDPDDAGAGADRDVGRGGVARAAWGDTGLELVDGGPGGGPGPEPEPEPEPSAAFDKLGYAGYASGGGHAEADSDRGDAGGDAEADPIARSIGPSRAGPRASAGGRASAARRAAAAAAAGLAPVRDGGGDGDGGPPAPEDVGGPPPPDGGGAGSRPPPPNGDDPRGGGGGKARAGGRAPPPPPPSDGGAASSSASRPRPSERGGDASSSSRSPSRVPSASSETASAVRRSAGGGRDSLAKARLEPIRGGDVGEPALPDEDGDGVRAAADGGSYDDEVHHHPGAYAVGRAPDPPPLRAGADSGSSGSLASGDKSTYANEPTIAYDRHGDPVAVARAVDDDDPVPSVDVANVDVADGVVIATKDNLRNYLRRDRRARWGLAAVAVTVVGLAVGVGVALAGREPPGGGEDFWLQVLDDMDGEHEDGGYGSAVSASGDGTRVAVGAPGVWERGGGGGGDGEGDFVRRGLVEVREMRDKGWAALGEPIRPGAYDGLADVMVPDSKVRTPIAVDISRTGDMVAVGSPFHDAANVSNVGRVEVYRWTSGSWELAGEPITGSDAGGYFGASVSLSGDGGIVAVGAPGIHVDGNVTDAGAVSMFQLNKNVWEDYGSRAAGESAGERLGGTVSLSSDGRTVAAGSSASSATKNTIVARVFAFRAGDWKMRGSGIHGGLGLFDTAYDVALSAKGDRVVISNHYIAENGPDIRSGKNNTDLYVRAFHYDADSGDWASLGENMHTNYPGVKSGYFITLSDDGGVIGMGDPGRTVNGGKISGHAHIYVYREDVGDWGQVGPNIEGEAAGDMFGYQVSISGDGRHLLVGAPSSRGNGFEHGRAQVYRVPDHV